MLITSTRF